MNKEEIIARPYEEYYEMIKDMSKDNMIQGLYDLSKECIEKQNYINQIETNRDEAIELLKEHLNSTNYEFEEYEWFGREYLEEVLSKLERGKE